MHSWTLRPGRRMRTSCWRGNMLWQLLMATVVDAVERIRGMFAIDGIDVKQTISEARQRRRAFQNILTTRGQWWNDTCRGFVIVFTSPAHARSARIRITNTGDASIVALPVHQLYVFLVGVARQGKGIEGGGERSHRSRSPSANCPAHLAGPTHPPQNRRPHARCPPTRRGVPRAVAAPSPAFSVSKLAAVDSVTTWVLRLRRDGHIGFTPGL